MKLAIGLIADGAICAGTGTAPVARPCDRAPAVRPNAQAPPAAAAAVFPAAPEDIAEMTKLPALPAWFPGAVMAITPSGRTTHLPRNEPNAPVSPG